jgi:hypothetical protein
VVNLFLCDEVLEISKDGPEVSRWEVTFLASSKATHATHMPKRIGVCNHTGAKGTIQGLQSHLEIITVPLACFICFLLDVIPNVQDSTTK